MKDALRRLTSELMMIPGLSGSEGRVRQRLRQELDGLGLSSRSDRMGNLIATLEGQSAAPSVMLFAHMDQLGMVVRKVEADGFLRVARLGGLPEKALPAQPVLACVPGGRDCPGLIASKSHHATAEAEKYRVLPCPELYIDVGLESAASVREAGIDIGTPVVYAPRVLSLGANRLAGTAIDDRAGCAVVLAVAQALKAVSERPTLHFVFASQEEFNLRGAVVAAQILKPDIAIQLDLNLATDTPDMQTLGEVSLGAGPAMSLYSFHGRGTLNGTLPHPALVTLFDQTAAATGLPLQRSAQIGCLTETSYVQLVGQGVAAIDLGFPTRYTHSAMEVCDLRDLVGLTKLLVAALPKIDANFSLDRDTYPD